MARFDTTDFSRRPIGPCGKIMFGKKDAATKRNSLLKMGNEKHLRIYQCPQCNAWHLTKVRDGSWYN